MKTFFKYTYIAILMLIFTACKGYQPEEAIKNGDIVNLHGKISNLDKFERFIANVESGKKDEIRIAMYTIEGDPIFYNLNYNGVKIKYTYDNSQDAHGGSDKGKRSTSCTKIQKEIVEQGIKYNLSECSSDVGKTFNFDVRNT